MPVKKDTKNSIIKDKHKLMLREDIDDMLKNKKSLEDVKKNYLVEEYDLPKDYEEFVNSINIFKNEYIFQGMLVYEFGTMVSVDFAGNSNKEAKNISSQIHKKRCEKSTREQKNIGTLRPYSLSKFEYGEENNYKIKIFLFYSHNRNLKGYLYDFGDNYLYLLSPSLTRKYIKQNKNIKRANFIENMQVLFLETFDDLDEGVLAKVNYAKFLNRGTVILYREKETYEAARQFLAKKHGEDNMMPIEGVD